jgi:spore coat polysaccharide biosynthesis protein SpsF (cytidylyltransferase family)
MSNKTIILWFRQDLRLSDKAFNENDTDSQWKHVTCFVCTCVVSMEFWICDRITLRVDAVDAQAVYKHVVDIYSG